MTDATHAERPRRSALYLPASNGRAIEKSRSLPADILILDLEDAVAPEAKVAARTAAVEAVRTGGFGDREVAIRINGEDSEWGADDLAAVAASGADAILVPKIASPAHVRRYDEALKDAPGNMRLWAMIETCSAMLCVGDIAALAGETRLSLFVLGLNDLAKEMRAPLTPDRAVFGPILSQAVLAARTHGITVLDGVCNNFRDLDVFRAEAEQGRDFGFDGKTLIHPAQVEPCNAVFSPGEAAVAQARAIIAAFERPEHKDKGVIQVDGSMFELLHLEEARRTVAIAERITAGD